MANALAAISAATENRQACISLQLGDQPFGMPMAHVRDVTRRPPIAPVPLAPDAVVGITHSKGRMVTVLDLRTLLGLPECTQPEKQVMAVVEHHGDLYGLLADTVNDVLPLAVNTRQDVPADLPASWRSIAESAFPLPYGSMFIRIDLDKLIATLQ